ncbi:MAG: type IV pilus modification PilV family protein [Gemmatimonadales bacterium]
MSNREQGFTIVEVLIAVVMLSIGVLAIASSAGSVTRMMYGGKAKTEAAALGQSLLDSLRAVAQSSSPVCSGLTAGTYTPTTQTGYTATAIVASVTNGRTVVVRLDYRIGTRAAADTFRTTIHCP